MFRKIFRKLIYVPTEILYTFIVQYCITLCESSVQINDSKSKLLTIKKTEFIIIRLQFSKVVTPNLTVTVGDTEISSSDKAKN